MKKWSNLWELWLGQETDLRTVAKPGSELTIVRLLLWGDWTVPRSAVVTMSENIQHDIDLLERIARQERDALGELYDLRAPALFGMACRMLNNESDAEDVLQEVFIRIWERAVSYDSRLGTPIAWLVTLTRNCAHDRMRSSIRRNRTLESFCVDDNGSHPTQLPCPAGSAIAHETVQTMQEAMNRLPPEQRLAIEMAFLGGLSQSEIADKLNAPLGTIKARIRRGLLALREHLPPEWRPSLRDSISLHSSGPTSPT